MLSSLRLEVPPSLVAAKSLEEARSVLPFSFEVGTSRHRSLSSLQVRYLPRPEDAHSPFPPTRPAAFWDFPGSAAAEASASAAALSQQPASRRPMDSYVEIMYPFSSNEVLREQYRRFQTDKLRIGLLLEDMDTFAGDIAARHTGCEDRILLTAFVDRISWLTSAITGEVTMQHDLKMAGEVVYVGKSSMEVLIELSTKPPEPSAQWEFRGFARFVLVARSRDRTQGVGVPALEAATDTERQLQAQGELHMQQRQQRRDTHWARRPPTSQEVQVIHDLIRGQMAHRAAPASHRDTVPMAKTVLQTSMLMHVQDRNVFNVIFGGHLLRLAFEHAFSTAALHAGEFCEPVSMDDVAFLLPVPIGCLLRLMGQVVYTEGPLVRVHVQASKVVPGAPEQSILTNTFSFAFLARSGPVRPVLPDSMIEAMEYVLGRRQHLDDPASQALLAEFGEQQQTGPGAAGGSSSTAVGATPAGAGPMPSRL